MDITDPQFALAVLQIVWIDLLLSGDNAVVIALACRALPENQRRRGILLGAGTAVLLRIVFALVVSSLLAIPFLRIVGGGLLMVIAVKLALGEEEDGPAITESDTLWRAVRTIAIADAVMSLDNVVAVAAAAKGHTSLFIFGLVLSIPLIIMGASLITSLLVRFPAIVWAGAALLGWIAGEMIATDPFVATRLPHLAHAAEIGGASVAILVVIAALLLSRRRAAIRGEQRG
ncbi:TerC family protein [Methylobacterium flocculans]|uniref:TerC family protein n=1 Tax=Methylobacterium flocculans TaxID=2984843 RepID=UPI0021F32C23|nr:TerC family protein [Methylobacterium sp. FF17]